MTEKDFIYLNVNGLLNRYKNPSPNWTDITRDWTGKVVLFFKDNNLLENGVPAWTTPLDETVIKFSDLTVEGQDFVMSQEIERWLGAWDRQRNKSLTNYIEADLKKLERRFNKFSKVK